MKTTTILISCAFLGGAAFAQAGERTGLGDGTLPEFLTKYDLNEDGALDEEEVQAMKELRRQAREERREEIDTDGNGEISDAEREAAHAAMEAAIEAKRAEKFAEIADDGDADTGDGDDVITLDEFKAIPALADVDPERVAAMFARLDADGNGEVTLEEFTARLRRHRHHGHGDGGPRPPRPGDGDGGDGGPRPGDGDGGPRPGGDGPRRG